jgi:anti-sigma regulatory factor (Ser/Thr protein kinase)
VIGASDQVNGHSVSHSDEMSPATARQSIDRSDPRAARHARQFISGVLLDWDLADQREIVVLLVSEVVTNALSHTDGEIELTMSRLPGLVRVEVSDERAAAPHDLGGGLLDESGRGVPLLGGFSDRWGTLPLARGKVVWFELDDI